MNVPEYLTVAQWALLFALGFLLLVVWRQLGRVFVRDRTDSSLGPPVGSLAVSLEYLRVSDSSMQRLQPGGGGPVLVAFVDPTCVSCEDLVGVLERARQQGATSGMEILLLTSDPPRYLSVSDVFQNTSLEVGHLVAQQNLTEYRASATPLLVAIDGTGTVRWSGTAATPGEVRSAIRACRNAPGSHQSEGIAAEIAEHHT